MTYHQTSINVSYYYCYCNLPVSSTTMWSHPVLPPGNNWIQMWSLLVPGVWHWFETLCRFLLLQSWQSVLSSVDSCPGKTLMWGRALGQREKERYSPLVSDLSSQCPPHISACWQPFGARTCHAVTDLYVMCSAHTERFVWTAGKCVQSQNWHWVDKQDRDQGM